MTDDDFSVGLVITLYSNSTGQSLSGLMVQLIANIALLRHSLLSHPRSPFVSSLILSNAVLSGTLYLSTVPMAYGVYIGSFMKRIPTVSAFFLNSCDL